MGLFFPFSSPPEADFCFNTPLSQNGFRKHLVLSPKEIRSRIQAMPFLLKPTRFDPEIRHGHVPSVLPGVLQGHRIQEAELRATTTPPVVKNITMKNENRRLRSLELALLMKNESLKEYQSTKNSVPQAA